MSCPKYKYPEGFKFELIDSIVPRDWVKEALPFFPPFSVEKRMIEKFMEEPYNIPRKLNLSDISNRSRLNNIQFVLRREGFPFTVADLGISRSDNGLSYTIFQLWRVKSPYG